MSDVSNKSENKYVSPSNSSQQIHYSPVQLHHQTPPRVSSPTPRNVTLSEANTITSRQRGSPGAIEHILQPPVGILDYSSTPVISNTNMSRPNDTNLLGPFDSDVNMDDILLVNVGENHGMDEDEDDGSLFTTSLKQNRIPNLSKPPAFGTGMRTSSVGLLDVESMMSSYCRTLQGPGEDKFDAVGREGFQNQDDVVSISSPLLDLSLRSMEGGRTTSRRKVELGPRRTCQLQRSADLSTPISLELPLQIRSRGEVVKPVLKKVGFARHESFSDVNQLELDGLDGELSPQLNFFPDLRLSRPEDSPPVPPSRQYQPQRQDSLTDLGLSSKTENLDSIFCNRSRVRSMRNASFDDAEDDDSSSLRYLIRSTRSSADGLEYNEGFNSSKWGVPSLRRAHHLRNGGDCYSCTTDSLTEGSYGSIQESFTNDTSSVIDTVESRDEDQEKDVKYTLQDGESDLAEKFGRAQISFINSTSLIDVTNSKVDQADTEEQMLKVTPSVERDCNNRGQGGANKTSLSVTQQDEGKPPRSKGSGSSRRRLKHQRALDWLREIRLKENSVNEAASSKFLRTNRCINDNQSIIQSVHDNNDNGTMTSSTSMLNVFGVISHNRQESVSS
mmetsp:Transcript_11240/g.12837  ORF Transcript_11240/g.12837 Transcript_11240/m.12837 type:complete len:615 (+) Transcript_11240:277-2121(+)|eukprot:CAMPEP_0194390336 /NCGR_PEP_ID=MMETSP0174-20130528/109330_1 /TAXON_ID=216777 /ORGANISM="Proboscia alata, Strain PI-D3" /LENGTH=614 /DNA_ID=CAMNT_0039183547 /DNA_START=272 /DNA_END=2116 /DNA_ORIENTATION=-